MVAAVTRDDALTIVGMIAANWPGQQWTEPTIDAYARAIEPLDADITMKAVVRCVNELEFYPRVATLREYVRMEKRSADALAEAPVESQRMTGVPASKVAVPEWVRGWCVSRVRYQDFRTWPQQDPHGYATDTMDKPSQERYMQEGNELSVEMIFRTIAGAV